MTLSQMQLIDCAHEAGMPATLAAQLAEMVTPKMPWILAELQSQSAESREEEGRLMTVLEEAGGVSVWGDEEGVTGSPGAPRMPEFFYHACLHTGTRMLASCTRGNRLFLFSYIDSIKG